MPIREYRCKDNHTSERVILSKHVDNGKNIFCDTCGKPAEEVTSVSSFRLMPGGSGGFYKPSSS